MSHDTDSTLSGDARVADITIPASSRPLPRLTLSPPARVVHRRHSLPVSPGQPLRSSPLAGPVLSGDISAVDAEDNREGLGPCLTPDHPTLLQPPRSTFTSKASDPSRRVSFAGVPSTSYLTASAYDPLASLSREGRVRVNGQDDPFTPRVQIRTSGKTNPANTCSSATLATPRIKHSVSLPHSPPLESSDHWMTSNPYHTTPRFSRLSLTAPNVVLPVSARQYRRSMRKRPSTAPGNSGGTSTSSRTISIASSMHVAPRSARSSKETLSLSSFRSPAPSIASTSDMGTVVEEDDTVSIEITSLPPIKESTRLRASKSHVDFPSVPSRAYTKASEKHNVMVDKNLDFKGEIRANAGRQLQNEKDTKKPMLDLPAKRRGMIIRLLKQWSNVIRTQCSSRL